MLLPKTDQGVWIVFDEEPTASQIYEAALFSVEMLRAINTLANEGSRVKVTFYEETCTLNVYDEYHKRYRPQETLAHFLEEMDFARNSLCIAGKLEKIREEVRSTINTIVSVYKQKKSVQPGSFSLN
jgi:hypothetical protein